MRVPPFLRLLILLPAMTALLMAQQNTSPTIRTNSTLVLVPTLVRAGTGDLAYNLSASDFSVTDNGVAQRVALEEDLKQPLALVVLMQTGASAPRHFDAMHDLDTMLDTLVGQGPHQVALVSFDSQPRTLCPFVADLDSLPGTLTQPEPGDDGAAIYDALAFALDLLKQQPANTRRAILLLSQTHDSGSKTRIEDIVRSVAETNTAIYSVTFSPDKEKVKDAFLFKEKEHPNKPVNVGGNYYVAYFDLGVPLKLAISAMGKDAAAEAASLSGGESLDFADKHSFENDLGILSNHIANRYMLSFRPTSNQPDLHSIGVSLKGHPEMTVAARSSYWAAEAK